MAAVAPRRMSISSMFSTNSSRTDDQSVDTRTNATASTRRSRRRRGGKSKATAQSDQAQTQVSASAALAPYVASLLMMKDWRQLARDVSMCPNIARTPLSVLERGKNATRLPIHEACRSKAPVQVIEVLIQAYPAALTTRDSMYQFLPIHFACRYGNCPEVVEILLELSPDTLHAQDRYGQTPLALANRSCSSKKETLIQVIQTRIEASNAVKEDQESDASEFNVDSTGEFGERFVA